MFTFNTDKTRFLHLDSHIRNVATVCLQELMLSMRCSHSLKKVVDVLNIFYTYFVFPFYFICFSRYVIHKLILFLCKSKMYFIVLLSIIKFNQFLQYLLIRLFINLCSSLQFSAT